jgi:hypothetical protein
MARRTPRPPPPARLFFGVFTGFERLFDWVRDELAAAYGPLDGALESALLPFPETRTYARDMGPDLRRKFYFLEAPFPQNGLAAVKLRAIEIEERARQLEDWPVERPLNVDPGLLNDCRVILATTKDHSHRIYRGDGIWEEVTLVFTGGRFEPLPWTFPDFRRPDYHEVFERARKKHLEYLAGLRRGAGS